MIWDRMEYWKTFFELICPTFKISPWVNFVSALTHLWEVCIEHDRLDILLSNLIQHKSQWICAYAQQVKLTNKWWRWEILVQCFINRDVEQLWPTMILLPPEIQNCQKFLTLSPEDWGRGPRFHRSFPLKWICFPAQAPPKQIPVHREETQQC